MKYFVINQNGQQMTLPDLPRPLANFLYIYEETCNSIYTEFGFMVWRLVLDANSKCDIETYGGCEYAITNCYQHFIESYLGSEESEADDGAVDWIDNAIALSETDDSVYIFGIHA